MKTRHARDFRNQTVRVQPGVDLQHGVWYRTPLSSSGHLLSRIRESWVLGDAWCGMALGYAQAWDNEEWGGLWYEERTGGRCPNCKRREEGWHLA